MTRPHFDTALRPILALVCLFLAATARAQDVQLQVSGDGVSVVKVDRIVVVKEDATLVTSFPFAVKAPSDAGLYFWTVPHGVTAVDKGSVLEVTMAPKGQLVLTCKAVSAKLDKDGRFVGFDTKLGTVTVNVGEVTPPVPPVPPGPEPKPPGPLGKGTHVLFVYESADAPKLPVAQHAILYGAEMRAWLNANLPRADGKTANWRMWDKDVDASGAPKLWQDLLRRPRGSVPWLVVADDSGAVVYEGPLPANTAETIALLAKYLGQKQRRAA